MEKDRVECVSDRIVAVSGYLSILDPICEMVSVLFCSCLGLYAKGELTCVFSANTSVIISNIPVMSLYLYLYLYSGIWLLLIVLSYLLL